MTTEPNLQFWVMDVYGKAYKSRPQGEIIDADTGEVIGKRMSKPYLSPESKAFEAAVRECSALAGAVKYDFVRILVEIFWPARKKKTKSRRIEYPFAGRPDNSNVQKSVEDAIQRKKLDPKVKSRWKEIPKKLKQCETNPRMKKEYWEAEWIKTKAEVEYWRDIGSYRGAVVDNDNRTLDIRTVLHWRKPGTPKCVRVSVWEVQPEQYHTKELTQWLSEQ